MYSYYRIFKGYWTNIDESNIWSKYQYYFENLQNGLENKENKESLKKFTEAFKEVIEETSNLENKSAEHNIDVDEFVELFSKISKVLQWNKR